MKKGFEVWYHDGSGEPPKGPLDFGEFMKLLGEIDGDSGMAAPAGADGPTQEEEQLSLFDREPEEREDTDTGRDAA